MDGIKLFYLSAKVRCTVLQFPGLLVSPVNVRLIHLIGHAL